MRGYRSAFALPFFAAFALMGSSVLAVENAASVSYDLKVVIEPAAGTMVVRGKIDAPVEKGAKTLRFGLHEAFAIRRLAVNGTKTRFTLDAPKPSFIFPATRNVTVALPMETSQGSVQMEIEYRGRLKVLPEFGAAPQGQPAMDDQINSRMVELANYSSWYPAFGVYGHPIESRLEVSLPKGWTAICSGQKLDESEKDGRAVSRWMSAKDTDILILAAPNYKREVASTSDGQVEIYYTQLPQQFVGREGDQIARLMDMLTRALGDPSISSATVKHVFSPKRKGQGRAGIARPGMIVTSEGIVLAELAKDPKFSLFQDVAHEVAHFWWNFGAGQGDWINEAFAEYSSAVAVRQVFGQQEFDRILERYRSEVRSLPQDAPALSQVPFDGSGFVIRYYKGSLMLEDLRQTMGEAVFRDAAHEFCQTFKGRSIGTAEFRGFWKRALGEKRDVVDAWLDSPGGVPEADTEQATN